MGCGFACSALASTLSVYFYAFLGRILGKGEGDVRYMFFMSMAVCLGIGAWFLLRPKAVVKPAE